MTRASHRLLRLVMLALALAFAAVQPAAAQSVLRDSETELLFRDMSRPLIQAAGLDPANVKIVLINDNEINAFVAGGQIVYIHSGLLTAADNANQLQGVIAHELGHVAGGHVIRIYEGARAATGITILSLVLGVAAMAAGAPRRRHGHHRGRPARGDGQFPGLHPRPGKLGRPGRGILSRQGRVSAAREAWRSSRNCRTRNFASPIYAKDSYDRTHPLSSERIDSLTQIYQKDPAWNRPTDPAIEARFARVKAKLIGYVDSKNALNYYPESDQGIPAHYARAYAYHLGAYPEKALSEADFLLSKAPDDPFFLELKGQILLESGRPREAIPVLRRAVQEAPDQPMISVMLGHALIATEDHKNFLEAKQVLKTAVNRDNDNPFAWMQLGIVYDREGDRGRANLATAERNNLEGKPKLALASAKMAMAGIPKGTPDFLRAQDIALVSCAELKKDKKEKRVNCES